MSAYTALIRDEVAALGHVGANVRHVEAWMRLVHPTLDGLSKAEFRTDVAMAIQCIDTAGSQASEALAKCFGLKATPTNP